VATAVTSLAKASPPPPELSFGPQISEYCVALLHQLGLGGQHSRNPIRAVGLMSCTPGEGVTSIAAPLAAAAARHLQLRTVLVDCNLNNPCLHRIFGIRVSPGLRSALCDPERLSEFIQQTPVENLSVLTAGEVKAGANLDCGSPNLSDVFTELRSAFELVVVDAPSFGNGASSGIGSLVDGVVLVVEAERTRTYAVQNMASSLRGAGVNLLGVVMNKRREHVPPWLCKLV
jgi:capsular exopolysaccharide synthesis family protein